MSHKEYDEMSTREYWDARSARMGREIAEEKAFEATDEGKKQARHSECESLIMIRTDRGLTPAEEMRLTALEIQIELLEA